MITWSHQSSAGFAIRGTHSEPSGKPVIHFLHGTGYCGRTYWPMLKLLQRDFDIFISDVQGHGDSDLGGTFQGWNRSAELALEAWNKHSPRFGSVRHFAVGHSFGGVVSALMLTLAPTQFHRSILLDPVLFPPAMIAAIALADVFGLYRRNPMARRARLRRGSWPDRTAAYENLHDRGGFKGWTAEALQAYVDFALKDNLDGGVALKCSPEREAEIFGSYPRQLWKSLASVQTPIRMEYGDTTFPFVIKSAQIWQRLSPFVCAERVQGGHCYMQQAPVAASERIREFLLRE